MVRSLYECDISSEPGGRGAESGVYGRFQAYGLHAVMRMTGGERLQSAYADLQDESAARVFRQAHVVHKDAPK